MTFPSVQTDVEEAFRTPEGGPALARLARRHREAAHASLSEIHHTWLFRALQGESPTVRAIVAAHSPARLRAALERMGDLPEPNRPPHPEVLACVLSLWTERLVGRVVCEDHSPAVAGLTLLSRPQTLRLWTAVGRVKSALVNQDDSASWIHERLGEPSPELRRWADRDVRATASLGSSSTRRLALLGLTTALRLLEESDPFTSRWALQHLPYPIVRQARSVLGAPRRRSEAVVRLEGLILRTAWEQLRRKGRIAIDHPGRGSRNLDER